MGRKVKRNVFVNEDSYRNPPLNSLDCPRELNLNRTLFLKVEEAKVP